MNYFSRVIVFAALLYCQHVSSQTKSFSFKIVPLGIKGGIDEGNLSSYMLAADSTNDYLCLDAGTVHDGIEKAISNGVFKTDAATVLKKYIKGYFISHAHLDHVAGLIINSPEDSSKNLFGLPYCLDIIKDKYFTWKNWANFTNEGDKPTLNKYHYVNLSSNEETAVENTGLYAKAFVLSHSAPYQSSAVLVRHNDAYVLYLGDTGADEIEKSDRLHLLWLQVGELVKTGKLKAIFIETSFPDEQPLNKLFGHLTPGLLMKELDDLSTIAGKDAMKNLPVVITHMKPSGNSEQRIKQQLIQQNKLHVKLVFPQQGKLMRF